MSSLVDDHKNISGMLRALASAVAQGADVRMEVYGGAGEGGEAAAGYRQLAVDLGLADVVKFHGPAAPETVVEAMQTADAFVLFSRYENLPCVLLEAWSTGLPALATNVGGVGEHLGRHAELGVLLESEDEKGLTAAIGQWSDRKKRGEGPDEIAIAAYAAKRFTEQAVGSAIVAAYRSVLC